MIVGWVDNPLTERKNGWAGWQKNKEENHKSIKSN